jgi:hypothetical protein
MELLVAVRSVKLTQKVQDSMRLGMAKVRHFMEATGGVLGMLQGV